MNITLSGKNIDVSDALRTNVESGVADVMDKFNIHPLEINVTASKQGHLFFTTIHAHVSKNVTIRASGESDDAYAAFENALEKMRIRIRRHKEWLDHHHKHHDVHTDEVSSFIVDAQQPTTSFQNSEGRELSPAVIAETKIVIPRISVGEAVTLFDFQEEPAYVFRNSKNGNINVIYRRQDGNIGWVDPGLISN